MSALRPMELLRVAPTSVGAAVQLSVDGATGSPSVRIPLPLTPGRDGFGPSLSLSFGGYDPLSAFAHGWSLAGLPSVDIDTRDGLPSYDGRERYRCAGQEIVPLDVDEWTRTLDGVEHSVRAFRARIESSPVRVERWTSPSGVVHWRLRGGDGSVQIFGLRTDAPSSRIADPSSATRVFRWLLESAFDRLGNAMRVEYVAEDAVGLDATSIDATRFASASANRYVKRVLYGNAAPLSETSTATELDAASWHFEAVFDYGDHDAASPATEPSDAWTVRPDIGHSGRMGFEVRTRRLCRRVLMFHHFATELEEAETLVGALELDHEAAPEATTLTRARFVGYRTFDDARVSAATPWATVTYTDEAIEPAFELRPVPLMRGQTQLLDLHGEGLPGLLTSTSAGSYYARNRGDGTFARPQPVPTWPRGLEGGALQDFDRDGDLELFQPTGPSAGYWRFERRAQTWKALRRFAKAPSATENVTLADLSGDGRPDVVLFTESGITWWPNEGEEGFGEPSRVQLPVERMPRSSLQLGRFMADMTGDGLADIVEVKNGSVRYWPNLGRGHFGDAVVMDGAPRLAQDGAFDPARLLLVDLDQSGTADLLYLGPGGLVRATNRRGISFGALEQLTLGTSVPNGMQMQLADFYGDGSTCLVVPTTSAVGESAFKVLRLMANPGARQVLSITSPLGAVTELEWGHSVRHYLRDVEDGRGWETPLPAQRPVVDAVHRTEHVDGATQSERFRYHDGHYDPRTRSFALFAVVEHVDVDTSESFDGVVPLLSRRFLHTGEWDYLSRFAQYQYEGTGLLARPPPAGWLDASVPLLPVDFDEAWGAMTGSAVREELFALDAQGATALHPHRVTVSARSVAVSRMADDRYRTGLRVVPRLMGTSEYEQSGTSPRDKVERVLEVDEYLVPTLALQVGLPIDTGSVDAQQERRLALATTSDVLHLVAHDRFELAVPIDARTLEIHLPDDLDVLDDGLASTLATAIAGASAYDEPLDPDGAVVAARELTHARIYYWNDTRTAALSLGSAGVVVLPHHTEQAAYDRGQLDALFDTRVDPDTDLAALGYVEGTGGDADVFFALGPTSRFGGASTFHRLQEVEAYDGGIRAIAADAHFLVTASMTDQVGNQTSADIDYHVLAPYRLTDPNGTVQEVDYDPLGVTRRTSRYGHALDASSSLVDHGFGALTPGEALPSITAALADPEAALGDAESLLVYEIGTGTTPTRVLALAAEQLVDRGPDAGAASERARATVTYFDGFGRELQARTLVEPASGEVDLRWRVTGYVDRDLKQQTKASYEPFFAADAAYESALVDRKLGVATIATYDALGRVTRQDFPNGTLSTTTFGAWSTTVLDPNDAIGSASAYVAARMSLGSSDPEHIALVQAQANAATPVTSYVDALGRAIVKSEVIESSVVLKEIATLDIRGLSEKTTDRRSLEASTRSFDRLGRLLRETSMDAGTHLGLFDAEGREVEHWHEDTEEERVFDVAGRMTERHVTRGMTSWLAEQITYGEGASGAADRNQLGRAILVKDGAGTVATPRYGAFGEALETTRTLTTTAGADPDWSGSPSLEASGYTTKTAFDAMGRPTRALMPDGTARVFDYLRSGPLASLDVVTPDSPTPVTHSIVVSAEYNARGQQIARTLGNDVVVSNEYDAATFRLYRRRAVLDGTDSYQDLRHHYDPVGNLVYVDDAAQYVGSSLVLSGVTVSPERVFTYDARYQLLSATGRVHSALLRPDFRGDTPTSGSFRGTRLTSDGGAVARYARTFSYDDGGNLEGYAHTGLGSGAGADWTNEKWVSTTSNRQYFAYDLNGVAISDPASFFDARGQLIALPNVREMTWSARDQLRKVVLIARTGGDPDDDELYDYAADNKRIRKTTNRLVSGNVEKTETIYLDGCELRRVTQITPTTSTVILERWSSHAELEDGRVATLYRWVTDTLERETDDTSVVKTHFHLATNIGSVALEIDDAGAVLSYEEYFPYGGTAFVAGESAVDVGLRTLRFVGKDQDDSTGFYVFQFRYYAPFIGNWVSPDPGGEIDGPNLYSYCHGNPVSLTDQLGLDSGLDQFPSYSEDAPNYSVEGDETFTPSTGLPQYAVRVPTATVPSQATPRTPVPGTPPSAAQTRHVRHDASDPERAGSRTAEPSVQSESQLRADIDRVLVSEPFAAVVDGDAPSTAEAAPLEAEARLRADLDRPELDISDASAGRQPSSVSGPDDRTPRSVDQATLHVTRQFSTALPDDAPHTPSVRQTAPDADGRAPSVQEGDSALSRVLRGYVSRTGEDPTDRARLQSRLTHGEEQSRDDAARAAAQAQVVGDFLADYANREGITNLYVEPGVPLAPEENAAIKRAHLEWHPEGVDELGYTYGTWIAPTVQERAWSGDTEYGELRDEYIEHYSEIADAYWEALEHGEEALALVLALTSLGLAGLTALSASSDGSSSDRPSGGVAGGTGARRGLGGARRSRSRGDALGRSRRGRSAGRRRSRGAGGTPRRRRGGSSGSGLQIVPRPGMASRSVRDSQGRLVPIYGTSSGASTTDGHATTMDRIAEEWARSGDYEYVIVDRSWRTSTGRVATSRDRPDVVGVRRDGRVDAVEVASQTDTEAALQARLDAGMASLPASRRGSAQVVFPPGLRRR